MWPMRLMPGVDRTHYARRESHPTRAGAYHCVCYAGPDNPVAGKFQTDSLVDAFDARLEVLTEDKLNDAHADLIVMQLSPKAGFLDNLFTPII